MSKDSWISIKDKLPKKDELVLIANNESVHPLDNWVCCGHMIHKNIWVNQFDYDDAIRVTHWMPLPKPPKHEK